MTLIKRLAAHFLALILLATPAMVLAKTDLIARLPQAHAAYSAWLRDQGRADELTMTAEQKFDSSLAGRWFGPKDSTWIEVRRTVKFPKTGLHPSLPGTTEWRDIKTPPPRWDENETCQNTIGSAFEVVPGESLAFTIGRAVESCTDTPIMISRGHIKYPLPDLFGYNVQSLWYTGPYLILNLKAHHEYGAEYDGLAFWNLKAGWIHSVVAETRVGAKFDDDARREDPTQGLGVYLRDLKKVRIAESEDVVYVDNNGIRLTFWPKSQEWTIAR